MNKVLCHVTLSMDYVVGVLNDGEIQMTDKGPFLKYLLWAYIQSKDNKAGEQDTRIQSEMSVGLVANTYIIVIACPLAPYNSHMLHSQIMILNEHDIQQFHMAFSLMC